MSVVSIASHRRSGTHFLGEFIKLNWNIEWQKTHDFCNANAPKPDKLIYILRNPIDVLHSTYIWFTKDGGCCNPLIANAFSKFSFAEYLDGAAADYFGYSSCIYKDKDNFFGCNGMFYDPIRFWVDHVNSYINETNIRYEDLNQYNDKALDALQKILGKVNVKTIEKHVGHQPTHVALKIKAEDVDHRSAWNFKSIDKLVLNVNKHSLNTLCKQYIKQL